MSFLRKISLALVIAVLSVQISPVRGFSDISSDNFAYYSVQSLLSEGVIDQATYYRPDEAITRGEFLNMIMRGMNAEGRGQDLLYEHLEKKHTYADLPDVPVGSPYAAAVSWAVYEGIISGAGDGLFHGESGLNRAEASKMITLSFLGGETELSGSQYFSDVDIYAWYYPYVLTMNNTQIMRGYADALGNSLGRFGPGNQLTRGEAAVILERCLGTAQVTDSSGLMLNAYARSSTYLQVDFSEELDSESVSASDFQIRNSNGERLTIQSAEVNDPSSVVLTTDSQSANEVYTLSVANITAENGMQIGSGGKSVSFLGYSSEGGKLQVALSPDMSEGGTTGSNAAQLEFLRLDLSAGLDNGITIQSLDLKRRGLGTYDEIENIRAIQNNTNIAEKAHLRDDNSITLNFSPYIILQPGQTLTLRILADFGEAKDGTTYHYLEVDSWSLAGNAEVEMEDRLHGPEYKRVVTPSGILNYTEQEVSGEIEIEKTMTFAKILLQAHNADIDITQIIFENEGTVDDRCFEDMELRIDGRRVADRLDNANDERLIFNLEEPYTLEQGSQEELTLKGKLTCGLGDILALHIDDQSGISATDTKYGYGAQIVRDDDSALISERTVEGGLLTITPSSSNPNNLLIYANGTSEKTIAAFRLESSGEDLVLEDIDFELITSGMEEHFFEELTFYWGGREVEVFSPRNLTSQTLTLSGPIELDANRTKTLTVKAKMGKILTEEEGNFQLLWHALSDNAVLFDAEKVADGSQLTREEVSPSGELTIYGGEIRVREDR